MSAKRVSPVSRRRSLGTAAAGVVCLVVVSAAAAAAPLAYVTPSWMASRIQGAVPQIPTDNVSVPSNITGTTCKGLPPAKGKKFNTFRCKARWSKGIATISARALPGGKFCASSTGIAACPPGPTIAGDPRICSYPPTPPTADPNRCAQAATLLAITRAMPVSFADPGWKIRNASCSGSNVTRKCIFSSFSAFGIYYTSTIRFAASDGAWTATIVTTSKDGGSSTCSVQPGTSGVGSRWQTGPTPTCTTA